MIQGAGVEFVNLLDHDLKGSVEVAFANSEEHGSSEPSMHLVPNHSLEWLPVLGQDIHFRMIVEEMLLDIIFIEKLKSTDEAAVVAIDLEVGILSLWSEAVGNVMSEPPF